MMRYFRFLPLLFAGGGLFWGAVLPAQVASVLEGCPPLAVSFTPPAGAGTYAWDFGNGQTSSEPSPSVIYTQPGQYVVTFRPGPGQPVIAADTVVVLPRPSLAVLADPLAGCRPQPVQFTNLSVVDPGITVLGYNWTFGDGGSSTNFNPLHAYNSAGLFSVSLSLTAAEPGCNTTASFFDLVQVNAVTGINFVTFPNPASTCKPPLSVNFVNVTNNTQGLTFTWDLGNGQTFTGFNPPPQTYTLPGVYQVTLTATDSLGCQGMRSRQVTVRDYAFQLDVSSPTCVNDTVFLYNYDQAPNRNFNWTFPAGVESGRPTARDSTWILATQPGVYPVQLRVENVATGCVYDTILQVVIDQVDTRFVAEPTYSCDYNLEVNYTALSTEASGFTWLLFNNPIANTRSTTANYSQIDHTVYGMHGFLPIYGTLVVENPSGCIDTTLVVDTLFVPNALFMTDVISGCAPLTVTFSDSSASFEPVVEYVYDYGDGTTATFTNDEPHTHTFTEPGTYAVQMRLLNTAGCRDTSYQVFIDVGEPLTNLLFAVSPQVVCRGEPVQVTVSDIPPEADSWHFTTGQGRTFHCFNEPEPTLTFAHAADAANLTLTVEYNGCYTTLTSASTIEVQGPEARLDYVLSCENPRQVTFVNRGADNGQSVWDFGDGQTATGDSVTHTYAGRGDYRVTLTARNDATGCQPAVDSALVCIRELAAAFELPDWVCQGSFISLDARASTDVDNDCYKGYTWYFDRNGRPITSSSDTVLQSFPVRGLDTVTLVVEDVNGCYDTLRKPLWVFGVEANFLPSDDLICAPATVQFTDLSQSDTTLVSWSWSFDNQEMSSEQNPFTSYLERPPTDTAEVRLQVTDQFGCTNEVTGLIVFYEPVSTITTDPATPNICTGDAITFTASDYTAAGSNLIYAWNFGNGQLGNTPQRTITYAQAGTYTVALNYVELASGCGGSTMLEVGVQDYPQAGFVSDQDTVEFICFSQQIEFTNQTTSASPTAYLWDFGNGDASSSINPTIAFGQRGQFVVSLVAITNYGCRDTFQRTYQAIQPSGSLALSASDICLGDSITFSLDNPIDVATYAWNFGDGAGATNLSPVTHAYTDSLQVGLRTVTLSLTTASDDCTLALTTDVLIADVRADFGLAGASATDTVFCPGRYPLENRSVDADGYWWDLGNGQTSTASNPEVDWSTPGLYTVLLVAQNTTLGCTDTLARVYRVAPLPSPALAAMSLCQGDTLVLGVANPGPGDRYRWSPAALILDSPLLANPTAAPQTTTTFTVEVTNPAGCTSTATGLVTVVTPPEWRDIDTLGCVGDELVWPLPPNPDSLLLWSWTTGPPSDTVEAETREYELLVADLTGCFEQSYRYRIAALSKDLNVPNIFSPNGDGVNDWFGVFADAPPEREDLLRIESLRVYNRWGQLVYEGAGPGAGWDGHYRNNPAPPDVYIYYARVALPACGSVAELRGEVTLLR